MAFLEVTLNQIKTGALLMLVTASLVAEPAAIPWQQWGKAPFEQAQDDDKLVILGVGMACLRQQRG
jgi:hypothetical protein